jgi:hypothetical protein
MVVFVFLKNNYSAYSDVDIYLLTIIEVLYKRKTIEIISRRSGGDREVLFQLGLRLQILKPLLAGPLDM